MLLEEMLIKRKNIELRIETLYFRKKNHDNSLNVKELYFFERQYNIIDRIIYYQRLDDLRKSVIKMAIR
ncbi:hypothetical protein Galf_2769 [Gallionella capsiferriformans ES-2]|uniref:Uncharacterized protein n=2 Tax=Gallionella TaxID=96 RepID=D9SDG6_GALCS|nr:hypothetical protein Galf_2769 [Gallionella capsiferriformans ES-2]